MTERPTLQLSRRSQIRGPLQEFTRNRLLVSLDRPGDKEIVVTFGLSHSEFDKASQVLKIISGEISPFD